MGPPRRGAYSFQGAGRTSGAGTSSPPENGTSLPHGTGASLPHGTGASLPPRTGASLPPLTGASLPHETGASLPPGATGQANSFEEVYSHASLAELKNAPGRRNMPHLHPERIDGTLWFNVDDEVEADIRRAWKADFWGPWWNWSMVPPKKKDAWWACFVQKYYWDNEHETAVFLAWKKHCQTSISSRISQKKLAGTKPDYIGKDDWKVMNELWLTDRCQKRSKINSDDHMSDKDGNGVSVHTAGASKFAKIGHQMTVAAGGVRPSIPDLVRRTHSNKDGTFVDKRAEFLVTAAETLAKERCMTNSEDHTQDGSTATPTPQQLTAAYLETALPKKGRIYGLGSLQYANADPSVSVAKSIARNIAIDDRFTKIDDKVEAMRKTMEENNQSTQEGLAAQREATNVLLRINGIDPATLLPFATQPPTVRSDCSSNTAASPNQMP